MESTTQRIQTAFRRSVAAMELRPGVGLRSAATRAVAGEGLTTRVTDGPWSFATDMGERYGWDRAVEHYEGHWARQLLPAQRLLLSGLHLRPGEAVVDVACGTGLVTFPAVRAVAPTGEVVGTDISQRMVDAAARVARERGLDRARFLRSDAEALDLPDGSFDAALCALGLMYFPDPLQAVREMLRVLRPSGRLGVAVWGRRAACGWAEIFPIVDARVESEVCPLFFLLGTGDALAATLREGGAAAVRVQRISAPLLYPSPEEALGAAFAGGPVALAYSRFNPATREEAHREYLASIQAYRVGEGYKIPGEFVVGWGVKGEPAEG